MPLNQQKQGTGRQVKFIKDREKVCLTRHQTRYIYKKLEKDSLIDVGTMTQEIEEDRLNNKNDSEVENPYQAMTINDFEKIYVNINASQMEQ